MTHNEFIQNILNTRGRFNVDGYKERHHIIPECCGGETIEENLIDLTAQEHYEAHRLLAEENPDNYGLQLAWWNFCIRKASPDAPEIIITAEEYAIARKNAADIFSKKFSGEGNPMYGVSRYGEQNPMWGKSCSDYCKQRTREANSHPNPGFTPVKYWKDGKAPMKGKHHSDVSRKKMSVAKQGKRPWNYGLTKEIDSRLVQNFTPYDRTGGKNPRAIKVRCLETNELFLCIKDAMNWLRTFDEYSSYKDGRLRKGIIDSCQYDEKFLLYTFKYD